MTRRIPPDLETGSGEAFAATFLTLGLSGIGGVALGFFTPFVSTKFRLALVAASIWSLVVAAIAGWVVLGFSVFHPKILLVFCVFPTFLSTSAAWLLGRGLVYLIEGPSKTDSREV